MQSIPLVYVEVNVFPPTPPARNNNNNNEDEGEEEESSSSSLLSSTTNTNTTAAWVKLQLRELPLCMHLIQASGSSNANAAAQSESATATATATPFQSGYLQVVTAVVVDTSSAASRTMIALESEHLSAPTAMSKLQCACVGFIYSSSLSSSLLSIIHSVPTTVEVTVTDETLVRIIYNPPLESSSSCLLLSTWRHGLIVSDDHDSDVKAAAAAMMRSKKEKEDRLFQSQHNKETLHQLSRRLNQLLSCNDGRRTILIGTTESAITQYRSEVSRRQHIRQNLLQLQQQQKQLPQRSTTPTTSESNHQYQYYPYRNHTERCLLVHSPDHGAGKTRLVRMLARQLNDHKDDHREMRVRVQTVRPALLLALYGVYADTALATLVHELAFATAVRNQALCLIVDGLDSLVVTTITTNSDSGNTINHNNNALRSTIHGMISYLLALTSSLTTDRGEVPFPVHNRLYNLGVAPADQRRGGFVASVRIACVGIVTCADDAFRLRPLYSDNRSDSSSSSSSSSSMLQFLLQSWVAGRYRLPALTAETRLHAFRYALQYFDCPLDAALDWQMAHLAAAATWAMGPAFAQVAQLVLNLTTAASASSPLSSSNRPATVQDFTEALSKVAESHCMRGYSSSRSPAGAIVRVEFVPPASSSPSPHSPFLSSSSASCPSSSALPSAPVLPSAESDASSSTMGLVSFANVGGNQPAICALQEMMADQFDPHRRRLLRSVGIMAPSSGILLYGPPGTGKTLLAKAIAQQLGHSRCNSNSKRGTSGGAFISLSSSDLIRAEVGVGEKLLVEAFEAARMNAPAVIFIDEFQALFVDRSFSWENHRSSSGRMTTVLMECMDDIRKWADLPDDNEYDEKMTTTSTRPAINDLAGVIVLAATNTPWLIDKAFLRPGRFDESIHVGLPSEDERAAILRLYVGRMKTQQLHDLRINRNSISLPCGDSSSCSSLNNSTVAILCSHLAAHTHGFSGADLEALCRAAAVRCLMEDRKEKEQGSNDNNNNDNVKVEMVVKEQHFWDALQNDIVPSSSTGLVKRNEQWKKL